MKKSFRRFLSLLLALTMALSLCTTGWAANTPAEQRSNAVELELEDLDPATLHVKKLGEAAEEEEPLVEAEPPFSVDQLVRVSIFLNEPAALDAGFSTQGVGTNSAAIRYRENLKRQQDAVTAEIEEVTGSVLDVQWNMTLALNAISAYVRYGDIAKISAVSGVKKVVLENRYEAPRDEVGMPADPNTANTSENMVGAVEAWNAGYTGAGSRIAIIDTGLDTGHQSFNADAFNYAISQLDKDVTLMTSIPSGLNGSGTRISAKIPYAYNYVDKNTTVTHQNDTQGNHGSHVAGIAAANRFIKSGDSYTDAVAAAGAVGMAPDAQLLVMKVFGAGGGAYDSDYMVAIEDAIAMDCDSVNLSLGSAVQGWTFDAEYQDILNNLVDKAKNEGTVVSISAGNSYDFAKLTNSGNLYKDDVHYHTGGSPGSFVNSLCVAAAQNTITKGTPMNFNGNQDVYYYESTGNEEEGTTYTNPALTTIKGTYDYVYIDAKGAASDYSAVNSAVSLSGKIVIVNRGELSFVEKGENAKSYNPKAVIIANNGDGTIYMDLTDFTGTFPMVTITLKDANAIKANSTSHTTGDITYYTGSVEVTTTEKSVIIDRSEATITDFSSWGVPGSLLMKPEITAPGGDIYSVNGTNKTSSGSTAGGSDQYVNMSGTSMAAPHITGLAAVAAQYLRENPVANTELSANYSTRAILQSLLMSTATAMKPEGQYLSVLQQGAGLADVNKAINASSVLMMNEAGLTSATGANADGKVKVELGDDPARKGEYTYSFTLYNLTEQALSYELSTELFTQKISGEFLDRGTSMLPAGGVTYVWNGEAPASDESHDVNKDGVTDDADAQAILDFLSGKTEEDVLDLDVADMDGDDAITSYDAHLLLNWEPADAPADGYLLAPLGTASVEVTISLTDAQKAFLDQYANGAYLEGFTYVKASASTREGVSLAHTHSIPILGFYGSWTEPSMFDNMSYVDELYGADRLPYSGNTDTNYLRVNYNGATVKFSGNPYMVEDEFPADRLAVSSNTTLVNIAYNLIRAAATTGFAVTRLDDNGNVAAILSSTVTGNSIDGQYYSNSSGWQNTGTKLYSINKTVNSYGLSAGDRFRVGFYAIPEYNGMLVNDSYNEADSGLIGQAGFNRLLTDNVLGKGAFIGYDFTVDNEEPKVESATLSGSTLTVSASDNENLAYVAVLSLDGSVVYAESAPGAKAHTVSFDASDAIANANGYVAAFVGDYAGNEAAVAIKVNDNVYQTKDVYVLTDTVTAGDDYLILNTNAAGTGYALSYTLNTSGTTATVARASTTVNAGTDKTGGQPYVDTSDVAATAVWTAGNGSSGSYKTFNNNGWYLRSSNSGNLTITKDASRRDWTWSGSNNRLSNNNRYLRYYNNTFSLNTATNSVYLYHKTTILSDTPLDPYAVTDVTVTPSSLDLYKGNTADLVAKVIPLTASDRTVTWSSSNNSVATVDENGHVNALAAGSATITATSNGDSTKSASCAVTVTAVNKALNAIVWDEAGDVYFSSFNANNLPTWTKSHSESVGTYLHNAMMADASSLYASTCEPSGDSVTYTVDRSSYALTEVGANYVAPFGMARGHTGFSSQGYNFFVYGFAKYIILGRLDLEEDGEYDDNDNFIGNGNYYVGMPYGLLDLSTTNVGDAYICAVCPRSVGSSSSSYYFLDETGKIWQITNSYSSSAGFAFGSPTLVVDTGIGTSFLYQSLYYDGTNIYWTHSDGSVAELIIYNVSTKKLYHAGDFGDGVWPAAGLYVNGSAAPASVDGEDVMEVPDLTNLAPVATREELMTPEIMARLAAETQRVSAPAPFASEPEIAEPVDEQPERAPEIAEPEAFGGLNAVARPNEMVIDLDEESEDTVTVTVTESEATTNGLIAVAYDPTILTYKGSNSDLAYSSIADTVDGTKGVITFAYANKTALAADTTLVTLTFSKPTEATEIELDTLERGSDVELDEIDVISLTASEQLPTVKFYGSSLSLDGEIALNYYLVLPDEVTADPDSYYVTLNNTRLTLADAKTTTSGDLTLYIFKYRVDAKRMGMDVTLRVRNSEDKVLPMVRYSNEDDVFTDGYVFSAQRYIQQTLATSTNEKLIALVEAMSDFGSLAQKQFNYDVANAAALYHADDIAAVTAADLEPYKCQKTETARKGIEFSNMTLVLESETTMKLFFKLNEGEIGDYTFTVDGKAATATETANGYVIEVKNIAAKNLDKFYKVVVRDSQGVCLTVKCTALNYSYLVLTAENQSQTLIDLVKSIYLYNKAANTYFAK